MNHTEKNYLILDHSNTEELDGGTTTSCDLSRKHYCSNGNKDWNFKNKTALKDEKPNYDDDLSVDDDENVIQYYVWMLAEKTKSDRNRRIIRLTAQIIFCVIDHGCILFINLLLIMLV